MLNQTQNGSPPSDTATTAAPAASWLLDKCANRYSWRKAGHWSAPDSLIRPTFDSPDVPSHTRPLSRPHRSLSTDLVARPRPGHRKKDPGTSSSTTAANIAPIDHYGQKRGRRILVSPALDFNRHSTAADTGGTRISTSHCSLCRQTDSESATDPPSMALSSSASSRATFGPGLGSNTNEAHELVLALSADSDNRKREEASMGYALDAASVSVMMMSILEGFFASYWPEDWADSGWCSSETLVSHL